MNLRRLIARRLGGYSNVVLLVLSIAILFLLYKNYRYKMSSHDSAIITTGNVGEEGSEARDDQDNDAGSSGSSSEPDADCVIEEKCAKGTIPYKLISGSGMSKYPMICFNGKLLVSKDLKDNKIGRGLNVVIIDKKSHEVKLNENFDTFNEDAHLFRMLKTSTEDGDIIMMASYDEMSNALREITIKLMELYGSQLFGSIKFRDSYVMLGQRGVAKGKAIELVERKKNKDFAGAAKLTGCASFPLGALTPVKFPEMSANVKSDKIGKGDYVANCGMKDPCKSNEFAVHLYNGKDDKDEPKICVDGKYYIGKGINDAGRGINIVVVGNGKEVLSVAHFDTYQEDSTNLEIFLEGLNENCLILAVTFDEASVKLGALARNLLYELGSALIQNLRFRDGWIFIGRKGIDGFSPIEEISYAGAEAFPSVLDKRYCVPQTLKGLKIRPDPLPLLNERRRDFCSKYDGFAILNVGENVDKVLDPAPLINKTLEDNPVYSTPIIVIGAMSHNSLRMTLETIVMQPGINPRLVYVCLDEKIDDLPPLVELFDFNYVKIDSSLSYKDIVHKSLVKVIDDLEKDKEHFIIIEEELILSPDFLYLFSQLYDTYANDDSIAAISSFNPNSYIHLDGNSNLVYRVNDFPGLGFMLKRSVYEKHIKEKFDKCCSQRAWYNWNLGSDKPYDVLMPDVSRVFRRPYDISSKDYDSLNNLFNRKRKTNLVPFPNLADLPSLDSSDSYKEFIKEKLDKAVELKEAMKSCLSQGTVEYPSDTNKYFKIIYEQKSLDDLSVLRKLCKCFELFSDEKVPPKGIYDNSVLRFYAKHNHFILVGSMSSLLATK